ncbi:prepilin-type N-terminal cleavage/methylation domain-containing protein [Vibrio breoganii]
MSISKNGFTLIELVVVIVIIAVLAVMAAPRFLDLNSDARESMLQGAAAEFQQSINFAHQRWALEGRGTESYANMPGYAEGTDATEGSNSIDSHLDMNDVGYPLGVDKNDPMGAPFNIGKGNKACYLLWDRLLDSSLTATDSVAQAEDYDFYAIRQQDDNNYFSKCVFIFTKDGYDPDPESAKHVIWYDSRTGDVSYVLND